MTFTTFHEMISNNPSTLDPDFEWHWYTTGQLSETYDAAINRATKVLGSTDHPNFLEYFKCMWVREITKEFGHTMDEIDEFNYHDTDQMRDARLLAYFNDVPAVYFE